MSEFGFELNRVAPELAILTATLFHFLFLDFYITSEKCKWSKWVLLRENTATFRCKILGNALVSDSILVQ